MLGVQLGVLGTDEGGSTDLFGPSVLGVQLGVLGTDEGGSIALTCLDPVCWVCWVYCWYCGWKLWMASCMMSRGFMVSFSDEEMLCSDTVRPCPPLGPELYTLWGKAKRRATAARNISSPTKKFCQPADTVPTVPTPTLVSASMGLITPVFSRMAKTTPIMTKFRIQLYAQ